MSEPEFIRNLSVSLTKDDCNITKKSMQRKNRQMDKSPSAAVIDLKDYNRIPVVIPTINFG